MNEGTTRLTLTTKEFGGTKEITVVVTPKVTPTPSPAPGYDPSIDDSSSGGGRSGGGGGGGGRGSGGINNGGGIPTVTETQTLRVSTPIINNGEAKWVFDQVSNKFKLITK